ESDGALRDAMARGAQELRCSCRSVWPVDRQGAPAATAEEDRARHGFKREPDPRRAGDERLERPLRLHLLSPAVRVQLVWRPRTLCSACRKVHSADGWDDVLKPVVARYQRKDSRIYFRADAAFAMPRSTSFWRRSGSNTRSGYRPTRFCRAGSAICSRAMRAGSMPISATRPEPGSGIAPATVELGKEALPTLS